jgi:transposase-like protein
MRTKTKTTTAIIHALKEGKSVEEIAKRVGVTKQRVYQVRHKLKQQSKEEVRGYVRKTPKHPEKLQKVKPYVRGAKKPSKSDWMPTQEQIAASDVLARASKAIGEHKQMHNEYVYSKLNEAVAKNNDLFNEVKDQQAIIRYLEGLVVRLTNKSN